MAGEQRWSDETREEAVQRIVNGTNAKIVAEEMGIPRQTLITWHATFINGERTPYPGDSSISEMTDKLLQALWIEVDKIHQKAGKNGVNIDPKKIKDLFDAMKAADQMKRSNPAKPPEKPESPLATFKNGKTA